MTLEELLRDYSLWHVELTLNTGVSLTGYILDVKLPIVSEVFVYFLESNKAQRYLAKYNPMWLMPLPLSLIVSVELLTKDNIAEKLLERRLDFYSN